MKYLLFALCVACGPAKVPEWTHYDHYEVIINKSAEEFRPVVDDILAAFKAEVPDLFQAGGAGIQVNVATRADSMTWEYGIVGYADEVGSLDDAFSIYLRDDTRLDTDDQRFVHNLIIHEMGHCLGLNHSLDPTNVMFAKLTANGSIEVSTKQIIQTLLDEGLLEKSRLSKDFR